MEALSDWRAINRRQGGGTDSQSKRSSGGPSGKETLSHASPSRQRGPAHASKSSLGRAASDARRPARPLPSEGACVEAPPARAGPRPRGDVPGVAEVTAAAGPGALSSAPRSDAGRAASSQPAAPRPASGAAAAAPQSLFKDGFGPSCVPQLSFSPSPCSAILAINSALKSKEQLQIKDTTKLASSPHSRRQQLAAPK